MQKLSKERRRKHRFPMEREMRFKVLDGDRIVTTGVGNTIDISSGGVAFEITGRVAVALTPGTLMELSISWPILLDATCMVQLVVFGQVVRTRKHVLACNIERYEFRTQRRVAPTPNRYPAEQDSFRRWQGISVREAKAAASA
jgi:hypothetical protein